MDASRLRAEFPVLARLAFLNAGTDGPLPARAVAAAAAELERELQDGRAKEHFERRSELSDRLRALYAGVLGCDATEVSLTTSATEGIAAVMIGLPLGLGDEIVTSDEEHPGLQGALAAARELRGVEVRAVPFADVAEAVGPRTRLVACSHVSWMTGRLAPAALAEVDVPVLLDGAQGAGAVPTDVRTLGCDAYAAAGQKWCCGPDGSGFLYVSPELRERLEVPRRGYGNLEDANAGLAAGLRDDGRRFDSPALSAEANACALASLELLAEEGWDQIHERAAALASRLAEQLAERGSVVQPRDRTTLVSFSCADAEQERALLAESGVVVRNIPGRPWLRASVGAWNDETDLARLLAALRA
ncbi:MAG TPA: aminotransferase class V-fold PLP-dependent enzyme [Solirubrobacteraceae bacterium]|nr:aminotransferase class V-fold PLP-dependent enzyme [Solirubrobacteraceae bacterium]